MLAVPVRAFGARAAARPATEPTAADPLVSAAVARTGEWYAGPVEVTWSTDIPRSVGLAGSSAIVIAVLRAVADLAGIEPDPADLAQRALAVERDDLGIVAGLQDRAVQAFDAPVLVDLAEDRITRLTPAAPIHLVVAWDAGAGGDSGTHHSRAQVGQPAMDRLAALARRAGDAFTAGDAPALAALMGEAAALRADAAPLPPAHAAFAAIVEATGLAAASTGSGGAVSAVLLDDTPLARLTAAGVAHRKLTFTSSSE